MLPGSEYLLLRCRVQGVGVVNVGYMVTEKEKGERERERRASEKERGYVGWLVEKARDKAVVVAAGWVDLYVAGVEGARVSLTAVAAATAAATTAAAIGGGRRTMGERTGHTGNLPGELHHSGYHGTPETLAVPNCSLIPTGRYIVWVSASASGAYRIQRSEGMFGRLFPLDIKPWQVPLCHGGQEYKRTVPISASINPFSLIRISPLIAVSHTGPLLPP
ncbi:hypothetical protein ALC53_08617 [Atta colombica]|uniref:Uncharacterized protein n=1 Tax=Atta colombica TaxID=520822 RepID=A0A151I208_9HYME|nr:hypothetical protein ALC53_08617 [Atta colombica]